ncbi:MAG: RNA polymerase sigma factor [Myxococcota bacterium]
MSINSTKQIAAAQAGDTDAQDWIVSTYTPIAFRYAMRMLRNEQDAHDAAHDSMLKVLRSLPRYNDQWKFSTWVISITRNTCIDELRKRKHRTYREAPDSADTSPGPFELASRKQRSELVQDALSQLSPLYKDVLVLYHFEHLKYQEIAEVLDVPIGTVMNRIFRARQKLKRTIEATA